ncbi:MAG: Ppx/GppA phosphatase family protein [Geminicoccaceae bacterium]
MTPSDAPHHAVIDIGSNSVRLVVYDRLSRAPFPRFNEKSLCGLGRDLAQTGELSREAMDHALLALRRFVAIASAMEVEGIDILATEAVRRAANGTAFIGEVRRITGLDPHILDGSEEALYAAMGVLAGLWRPRGAVGDMGGGSLELALVDGGRVLDERVSLPLGALPVTGMLERGGMAARHEVDGLLRGHLPAFAGQKVFHLVGGGWRALARVHMHAVDAPVRVAHGYEAEARQMRHFAMKLWRMEPSRMRTLPGVPPRRASTLAAAALVLDRVLRALRPERVVVSALGLREGWLFNRLDAAEQALDPLLEGARAVGVPRARVAGFSDALIRWTDGLLDGETETGRRLRQAACRLSDIAWADHVDVQARDSFERLLTFPFIGLDHPQRVWLAAVIHARYGGRPKKDPVLHPAIGLLTPSQRRSALILGRAMLLAHRFSGSVPGILDASHLAIGADEVVLHVDHPTTIPDSDAVRARLKRLARAVGTRRFRIAGSS